MHRFVLVGALLACAACGDDDKTDACDLDLGSTTSAVLIQDRKVLGVAPAYTPDLGLPARDEELRTSIAKRREVAWATVAKVLAPVAIAEPGLAPNFGGMQPTMPSWHAWYGKDDYERIFKKLYRDLGPTGRRARAPIDANAGFLWNPSALDAVPEWTAQRYSDYLATVDTQAEANGLGGNARVGYSPGAMKHLLESYERIHQCRLNPAPDPFDASPVKEGHAVTESAALAMTKCEWKLLGPFQAATDAVTVTATGDGDADIYVRRGELPAPAEYDCRSNKGTSEESCTVDGDGPVYVAVFAAKDSNVQVDVSYLTADVLDPTCLDGEMPRDSVLVKADWRRQFQIGELIPVFNTTGDRMTQRFSSDAVWNPDGNASPDSSKIYTALMPATMAQYRLTGLHIMTKELDHWLWITLWWAPDPDGDFGADRPASITALGGPWANYKMCVATHFVEGDPDRRGGFAGSLGDALAAVNDGTNTPTWCSNPYLEEGPGNAATNCIGCHQHGGTELMAENILADLPRFGVTRVRNNFFTDYLWAQKGGGGEDLSALLQAEIDYWDASDP